MLQALTAISNDGKLLKPYIVSKIVDLNTKESTFEATTEVLDVVAESSSINKVKELMESVVCNDSAKCTGSAYYMDGYPLMGKTGTAQIYDEKTGTYMTGESDYVYSFAGLYPADNPEIIVYTVLKRPKDTTNYVSTAVKDIIVNTSKYLNIVVDNNKSTTYKLNSYINKNTSNVKNTLEENKLKVFILGDGERIINQYPLKGNKLYPGSIVVLLTDNYNKTMPNLSNLSYKDAINILKLMDVRYTTEGKGYVVNQNIPEGEIISENVTVSITLKE